MSTTDDGSWESTTPTRQAPLISDDSFHTSLQILNPPLLILTVTGIVTNAVNIRVFARQGVATDSTTLAFFSLSLTDLMSCVFMVSQPVCNYLESYADNRNPLVTNCLTLATMPATYTHGILSKVTCWITIYLSVERAVGVVFPMRVKRIFTVNVTALVVVVIYVVVFIAYIPLAANISIVWVQDPNNNTTLKALNLFTPLGYVFATVNGVFHSFVMTTVAMFIVTVSTVAMVTRLRASMERRKVVTGTSSAGSGQEKRNVKNVDTVRLVLAITSVYLVSLFCTHIPSMATLTIPGMSIGGFNNYLYVVIYTIRFDFEVFNSSVHMFFFVKMSSRHRATLRSLAWRR